MSGARNMQKLITMTKDVRIGVLNEISGNDIFSFSYNLIHCIINLLSSISANLKDIFSSVLFPATKCHFPWKF